MQIVTKGLINSQELVYALKMCIEWFWYLKAILKNKSFNFIVFLEEATVIEGSTVC